MPIQQLNRLLKHWPTDVENINADKFVEMVESISSLEYMKAVIQLQVNIQYGSVQITGDVNEVRSHIRSIEEKDEDPHVFTASWTLNTNPRASLSVQLNFTNHLVQLNGQNLDKNTSSEIKQKVLEFLPEFNAIGPQQPDKSPKISIEPEKTEYLPGVFRPIAMPELSDNDVFVIMSFDKGQRDAFFVSIEPTLKSLGFNPIRVDQIQHNMTVTPEIMRQIERSVFIVADLTGERPNVYYEVGYAHRADKEVILLSKKETAVHFDVAAINRIEYEDYTELSDSLRKRVHGVCDRLGINLTANK